MYITKFSDLFDLNHRLCAFSTALMYTVNMYLLYMYILSVFVIDWLCLCLLVD